MMFCSTVTPVQRSLSRVELFFLKRRLRKFLEERRNLTSKLLSDLSENRNGNQAPKENLGKLYIGPIWKVHIRIFSLRKYCTQQGVPEDIMSQLCDEKDREFFKQSRRFQEFDRMEILSPN
ncbi:MAG: hypothetical protein AAB638_00355 [Patescibacteria group bacterium]